MFRRTLVLLFAALLVCALPSFASDSAPKVTAYNFSLVDMQGKVVPLSTYKGKVLLIVNIASKSAYRNQIDALSELQKTYGDQGLVIIGIPSNDFGSEEQKDLDAVRKYYEDAHVAFSVFAPATLRGVHTIPLFKFLCDSKLGVPGGDLHWNYTKILIDREGNPLARYEVEQDPAEIDFHVVIENALAGKLKKQSPKTSDEPESEEGEGDDQ